MNATPFTDYVWLDTVRVAIAAVALLTLLLVVRIIVRRAVRAWREWRDHGPLSAPHNGVSVWFYVSYAATMAAIVGLRSAALGTPPDIRTYITAGIIITGAVGVYRSTEFRWQRARHDRNRGLR